MLLRDVIPLIEALSHWRLQCVASYQLNSFRLRAQQIRHAQLLADLPDPLLDDPALEIARSVGVTFAFGQGGCCG